MLVLSVLPLKLECLGISHIEFELVPFKCRRSCNTTSSRFLYVSRTLRYVDNEDSYRPTKKYSLSMYLALASSASKVEVDDIESDLNKEAVQNVDTVKYSEPVISEAKEEEEIVKLKSKNDNGLSVMSKGNQMDAEEEAEILKLEHEKGNGSSIMTKSNKVDVLERDEDEKERETVKSEDENNANAPKKKGMKVDVRALAFSLRFANNADDVEEVIGNLMEDLPLNVYSTMIRCFGLDKKFECAMAVFEWLKRKKTETKGLVGPNLFLYNSLLGAVKHSERFGELVRILEDMKCERVNPNVITYNTIMSIYAEQGQPLEALNVLNDIMANQFSPTPVSYSTALVCYQKMEDGYGALKFFVELREKYQNGEIGKDQPKEDWVQEFVKFEKYTIKICYQVMRQWLIKKIPLTTDVLKLLMKMDKAGLTLGPAEYEGLIWACTHEGHFTVVKELYKRIREQESKTEISLSVCNHVIWLMGKSKKWWAALEVYEDLLDEGPKPNKLSYELVVSHFNILLSAASKRGFWKWGYRLLNKMEEKGLKPRSREWNAVLVACSKAGETAAAVQVFLQMVEQGEKPTLLSYGALLSAFEKGKLYDEALRTWQHMIKVGVMPNVYAYTIIASIYSGQSNSEMVESVLQEMVKAGIEPTVVTFNAIISGCARNGNGSTAFEWFHRMKDWNMPPNEITYEMLIEALAEDAKPRLAYELYLRGLDENLKMSCKAYDTVILSAEQYSATIDISSLGPRPSEKKNSKSFKKRKKLTHFSKLEDVPRTCKQFDKKELNDSQTLDSQT